MVDGSSWIALADVTTAWRPAANDPLPRRKLLDAPASPAAPAPGLGHPECKGL
ncbi:MAG: hypothetical protein ACAH80_18560 [Alphaproteobacteria bacterium]